MKYRSADSFRSDFRRLPAEHQRTFQEVLRNYFLPAVAAGSFGGFSLTWNLASPDGRATFHLDKTEEGDPVLVWRRIGDHGIYDRP